MNLKPSIEADGQDYVDEYAPPEKALNVFTVPPKPSAVAVGAVFGSELKPLTVSFDRLQLRWMKSENGKLVPRC
jgi:hypothetical protein